ncbi:ubiquitin-specific protease ubp2 [Myotisia sp. PD_48]|nr:ubiquitin-specific protease ubp2 [Myotisia sp. PD_48]
MGRPGKTAPRFIQDVLCYDPANPPRSELNILTDILPVFTDANTYPEVTHPNSCPHRYITKLHQSALPPEINSHVPGATYKVSSVCLNCRYHIQLAISYKNQLVCHSGALHHFVYSSKARFDSKYKNPYQLPGQRVETYYFACSYQDCSANVSLEIQPPVLTSEWVDLLTDTEKLHERAEAAIKSQPDRLEGISPPHPINTLSNLKAYIDNALYDDQRSRPISLANKRFILSFGVGGEPCKPLLEFLNFKFTDDTCEPPKPNTGAPAPFEDQLNIFLDNVSHELLVLMHQRPQEEIDTSGVNLKLTPSLNQFHQLLGCDHYPKSNPNIQNRQSRAPFYEDLGALEDMANALIIRAYQQQTIINPSRATYYLRCLRSIAQWRGPEEDGKLIANYVSSEYQSGKYADDEVPSAFQYFGLNFFDNEKISEENIIGSFYARLEDSSNDTELRRNLWRIGDYRRSEKIKAVAEEQVVTVQQAEVFLGVTKDIPDDFIMSMYTAKVTDNPGSQTLANRAVRLIAESRKSDALQHFLNTGETTSSEMDIGDAFRLLQIPDRSVDDAAILAAYSVCCSEAPEQVETYRKALSVIAQENGSAMIRSMLVGDSIQTGHALMNWPVGLRNIGNTCYLNSLLQFYFTIAPLRNMVLNFERYKASLDAASIQNKIVGSRKVSIAEIQRSQKFLVELRSLFDSMITSPNSFVTPSQELARLTLLSSSGEAAIRRKSLSTHKSTELGEINGRPVQGPVMPFTPIGPVGGPLTPPPDEEIAATIEDSTPIQVDESHEADATTSTTPQTEVAASDSSSVAPREENAEPAKEHDDMDIDMSQLPELEASAPERPPPVPPRPAPRVDSEQLIREEVELGAQQDVTEVINNVLFQAQCAIKPTTVDENGNQMDIVMDLFYGTTKSYITATKGVRSKNELWSDIKVDVATGSRDIYAALDGAFDRQNVHVDGADAEQYGAISKLPPVLQIQVQRVQFDQVKKTSFKSVHHLDLKEVIYLDRYMDATGNDSLGLDRRRREQWAWKDEWHKLVARRAELVSNKNWASLPDLFKDTRNKIEDLISMKDNAETIDEAIDIDDSVVDTLSKLEKISKDEIARLEIRIQELEHLMDAQFSDLQTLPYHLYAVFMHHGSVEFGHYYIYIFDFDQKIWRKYNDTEVTEVRTTAEIFGPQSMKNPPTPYFLVYLNNRMKTRLAKPVCRSAGEAPEGASAPTSTPAASRNQSKSPSQGDGNVANCDTEMADMPPPYDGGRQTTPTLGRESRDSIQYEKLQSSLNPHSGTAATSVPSRGGWENNHTNRSDVEW